MSIRFSTEAANADVMGEDTPADEAPQGTPEQKGPDVVPGKPPGKAGERDTGDVKPGKDINAPGWVKDDKPGKPS